MLRLYVNKIHLYNTIYYSYYSCNDEIASINIIVIVLRSYIIYSLENVLNFMYTCMSPVFLCPVQLGA